MAHLLRRLGPRSDYYDKHSGLSAMAWLQRLHRSSTVYVGNLSFYTSEDQVYELFSKCGEIDMVVMGLNKQKGGSPCGFCFVRFQSHAAAARAVEVLHGVQFDGRVIRVDWDCGDGVTEASRRFGRGIHGFQWRDEFRQGFDWGRGGAGGGLDHGSFNSIRSADQKRRFEDLDGVKPAVGPGGLKPDAPGEPLSAAFSPGAAGARKNPPYALPESNKRLRAAQ